MVGVVSGNMYRRTDGLSRLWLKTVSASLELRKQF